MPKLLPPVPQIEAYIRSLGIDDNDNVVLVHSGIPGSAHDFGSAARVSWTFKVLGHDAVSILDGGLAGWKDAGQPVATSATEPAAPGDFTATFDRSIYASTADVAAAIDGPVTLVDSRDHEAFVGSKQTPYVAAAGTIPTSVNVDADTMLDGVKMAGADSLRMILAVAGEDAEASAITFCDSGHLSAVTWFAQHEILGNTQVWLDDGMDDEGWKVPSGHRRRCRELMPARAIAATWYCACAFDRPAQVEDEPAYRERDEGEGRGGFQTSICRMTGPMIAKHEPDSDISCLGQTLDTLL